jgi:HlyD family secretion protein
MALAEPRRTAPVFVTIAGIVVLSLILFSVRSFTHEAVEVKVTTPEYRDLVSTVPTNGKVEPVHEFQAHAPYAGVIRQVYVDVGQKVKPGTLLIKMADEDIASRVAGANLALQSARTGRDQILNNGPMEERIRAASDLQNARLEQQDALKNLAQMQQLQQKGAASAAEVAAAKQRLETAQVNFESVQKRTTQRFDKDDLERANAQVADGQASVAAARAAYNNANIRSPIAGTVYSIPVSQFDFVPGGDDLLDVADLNRIQIRAYFDEPEIGKLALGQPVKIVWDAKPDRVWHGHIELAPTTVITYGTRNVGECLIAVDDAKGDLLPNTNVTVTVTTSQRHHVLSIPREALHTDGTSDFVYRVVGKRLARAPVQVGVVNLTRVEVTSGLSDHDTVALNATGNRELKSGLEVKPVE